MNAAERRPPSRRAAAAFLLGAALLSPSGAAAVSLDWVSYSSAPATIDSVAPYVPVFSWSFTSSGGNGEFEGAYITSLSEVPPSQMTANLFRDADDDGVLTLGVDLNIATAAFTGGAGTPPRANLSAPGQTQTLGATVRYFVTVSFNGVPAGRKPRFGVFDPWSELDVNGQSFGAIPPLPLFSGDSRVLYKLFANPANGASPYPTPSASPRTGGADTGLYVNPGQRLQVQVQGVDQWNVGAGLVNGDGSGPNGVLGAWSRGALSGRVGAGPWFLIGQSTTVTIGSQGLLYVAPNDDNGWSDNAGFLRFSADVLPSTTTKVWVGGTLGFENRADLDQNWQNGRPRDGEKAFFGASSFDCDWNVSNAQLSELVISTAFAGRTFTVSAPPHGGVNSLRVSSVAVVAGGRFQFAGADAATAGYGLHELQAENALVVRDSATFALDNGRLRVGTALELRNGAFLRLSSSGAFVNEIAPAFGADWNFLVERSTLAVSTELELNGIETLVLDRAKVAAFDHVRFQGFSASTSPFVRFLYPAPVTLGFKGWSSGGSPRSIGVDAQVPAGSAITFVNSINPGGSFGSPRTSTQAPDTVFWNPDGGGGTGSIAGTLACAGVCGSMYQVLATTDPKGGFTPQSFFTSTGPGGAYAIPGLATPATYYLFAFQEQGAGTHLPLSTGPRGGFQHPGYFRSEPFFVPNGGNPTGVNLTIKGWGQVSGSVNNPTAQVGPIVVETWDNVPYVAGSTKVAQGLASPSFLFPTLAQEGAVFHSSHVFAYVDLDGDRDHDAFEASVLVANNGFTPGEGGTSVVSPAPSLSGGGAGPGGVVTLSTMALGTAISNAPDQPVLRLTLGNTATASTVSALKLRYAAQPPPAGAMLGVWVDDGDGSFSAGSDSNRGSFMAMNAATTGTVVFFEPVELAPSATRHLFVTVNTFGNRPSSAAVSVDTSSALGLSAGVMASQPSLYPVQTGPLEVRVGVPANGYASPDGYGGVFTGFHLSPGQGLSLAFSGSWSTAAAGGSIGGQGVPGTTGQNAILPDANLGELIGRVSGCAGCPSSWFRVGGATMPIANFSSGELHLAMNDYVGGLYDNAGSLLVNFGVSGATTGALSGTVYYSTPVAGNGYVTAYRYGNSIASVTVSFILASTYYSYVIPDLIPGEYHVGVTHQLNSDFGVSGKAFLAAGATTQLDAVMYQGQGTIAGPLSYAGVLNYGQFYIAASTSNDLTREVHFAAEFSSPVAGSYLLSGLPAPATYYVVGFRDGNFNQQPDGPEPFGYHGAAGGSVSSLPSFATPVFVDVGANVTGKAVALSDTGGFTGPVSVSTPHTGVVTIVAGHGVPGSASFVPESKTVLPVTGPTQFYDLGLMRSATDYGVFAFHDRDGDDVPEAGEPSFQTAPNRVVSSGSMSNLPIPLQAAGAPPASPRFSAVAASTSSVLFTWDGVSGATSYLLRRADDSLFASVPGNVTFYLDASLSANTSSQILKLVVANGNGASAPALLSTSVYSLAGMPVGPAASNLSAVGADVTWSAGVNPAGTLYRVYRSTNAGGANARLVSSGTALSFHDAGVGPDTYYEWSLAAVNRNGLEAVNGIPAAGVTPAAAGNVFIGTVTYLGQQKGNIVVQASTAADFTGALSSMTLPGLALQTYALAVPAGGNWYLRGFVDALGTAPAAPHPGADRHVLPGFVSFSGTPVPTSFTIAVDTVAPAAPAGLVVTPGFGSVSLNWVAPTKNANGSALADLLGYVVQRSSAVSAPFVDLQGAAAPLTAANFTDVTLPAGPPALYRVVALDLGRNASAPTAPQLAAPSAGGTISGSIRSFTAAAAGPFRVRLTSSAAPGANALAEVSVPTYTFTGLSDGTYFLRAYRDLDSNGVENGVTEPGGTYGGLNTPFAVPVVNGNAVTGADVAVCDRTQLLVGPPTAGSLLLGGCPARDKGPSNITQLFSLPVGNGAPGSLGLGSQVNISISNASFGDSELIVLGPDGSVVGRDNRPGGASLSFTASQPGVYLVEPTSFLPGSTGTFSIQLRLDGGFGGVAQGTVSYAGSRPGTVFTQLFDGSGSESPVFQSTRATPGFYSFPGLPDGVYTVKAFRDVNANLVKDLGEPAGQFGFSASSPTPVVVSGGFTFPAGGLNVTLADPAVGAMKGAVIYDGTGAGSIRIQAGLPSCSGCGDIGTLVASASTGAANAYFLDFLPAATSYVLRAFVDNNGNGRSDVLEPVVSRQNITVTAGSTVTVSVILQDPGSSPPGSAVIRGTVTYAGVSTGTVFVGFSRDPYFNSLELVLQLPATGFFQRDGVLGGSTYYMAGFIDNIPNGTPDFQSGEPRGTGGLAGAPGPFLASNPPQIYIAEFGVTSTSMTILDAPNGSVRGRVTYTGASAAPRIYVQAARFVGFGLPSTDFVETVITRQPGVTSYDYALDYMAAASDYYVQAFVDSNGNGRSDPGEPFNSRYPVAVSSGAGAFPAYGKDVTIFESGGTGGPQSAGRIRGDVSYLGSQSGPVFVRFFTNDQFSGQPFAVMQLNGLPGPGNFPFDKGGLPFGVTFYIDAFRDPSGAGVYNPTFHARAPLTEGGDGQVLSQSRPQGHAFGHIVDPGDGGSVNAFSGRLDLPAGARFDGGSFDAAASVVVDTWTGSPAPTYVVQHVTTQNDGVGEMLVRYSSAGVMLSSQTLGAGLDGVQAPVPTASGHVLMAARIEEEGSEFFSSTGVVTRLDAGFGSRWDVQYALADARAYAYSPLNGRFYVAGGVNGGSGNDVRVLEIDPLTMDVTSTGTYTMPQTGTCFNCGGVGAYGLAVSPDGQKVAVIATAGRHDNQYELLFLLRFNRAGPVLSFDASKDITGLQLPDEGVNLVYDPSGNLFASGVKRGESTVRTYKFDASLNQVASASLPNVVLHFEGGIGNVQVDPADGHVYQAWESTANAGDFLVLRYDNALNLLYTRGFDGLNNSAEDFPFSLTVLDSSNVVVSGGVNNGRTLDSAVVRFNMNGSGAVSAAGPAVTVTTVQPVAGTLLYAGSLVSSGVFRTVLLPEGEDTPLRFATAPFGASASYLFNNVPYGDYHVRSFLDLDGDLRAEAGEPVAWSRAAGEEFLSGSSHTVAPLTLCDRRSLTAGVPVVESFTAADCPAPDRGGAYQRLYTFTARRGEPLNFLAEGLGFSDTYLNLYGPTGELLTSADDGAGSDAAISGFITPEDGLYTVGVSPFAAGVTGSFRLTFISGSGSPGAVSGRVEYNGSQGGAIQVARFSSPVFSSSTVLDRITLASTRTFTFNAVAAGATYYFGAFVDVNANNVPDAGEDAGVFGAAGSSVPAPVLVQVGQTVTGVAINIAASTSASATASYITGQVTLAGAPSAGLILEFWSSAQFTGRPVATRLVPTGVGAFDVAVPGGVSYYVRAFLDLDGDFFPDAAEPKGVYAPRGQGAEAVFAPAGASVPNVDISLAEPGLTASGAYAGEGTGALMPVSAGNAGALVNIGVELTAGAHGIDAGGQFGFTVPPGFPFPSGVTASNTGGATLSPVTMSGPSAFVTVTAGSVAQGFTITLTWNNVSLPCAAGAYPFKMASAENGTAVPAPLLGGAPSFTVNAGSPEAISVNPPYFTLRVGELSDPLFVETRDRCGNKVAAQAAEVLELRAKAYNPVSGQFVADAEVGLTSAPLVSTASSINLGFAIGQSSRVFHAVALSTGFKFLELYSDLGAAPPATYYFGASVVPADALTNVRVATSPTGVAGSTASIGQTASGVPNSVYIAFDLGDPSQYWHVLFSTVPFKPGVTPNAVWERWGNGKPTLGELAWDGRYSPWVNGGNRVPNGLYYGRVELGGGGVKDDRLQVTVNVPQFSGRVLDAAVSPNPPLSGASLRVYGPAGSFGAVTGAGGDYNLPGLGAGSYRLNVSRPDYVDAVVDVTLDASAAVTSYAPRSAGVSVSSNASGGLDVLLGRAPRLTVVPSVDVSITTSAADQWGSLQVRPSTGSALATLFGPMRLRAGTTFFDDGGQWDPATQQFVARTQLSFNVPVGTYTVQGELPGFTRSSATVYVGEGGAFVALAPFAKKSSVKGAVSIPGPNSFGTFVSVTAVPLSNAAGAAGGFGGVFLNPGILASSYVVGGLDAGAYLLRANAQGLSVATTGPLLLAANTEVPDYHFPALGAGASLSGNITVGGNSVNGTELHINAWAPGSFNFGSTSVYTTAGTDVVVPYALSGLDAGATYQLYVGVNAQGADYDVPGGFPLKVLPQAGYDFTLQPASGVVSGLIILPAGATDFLNVELRGVTIASLRPSEVGHEFVEVSTTLPNFKCADGANPVGLGYCANNVSSATFLVTGANTQTLDITLFHRSSGQNARRRVSIVNGSTTTVTADLSGAVYSISGSILNQVEHPLFDTTPELVANAPYLKPVGYPAGLSSSTARVTAVRQELENYGVAISTVFNEATSRVGFIQAGGSFTIAGVPNGVYYVRTADLRSCATCEIVVPSVGRLVTVGGAAVSSVTLTLSDGHSVAGTITLDDDIADWGIFDLQVLNKRQEVVRSTSAYLGDQGLGVFANAVSYQFNNLPAGEFYTLVARDRRANVKYVARPIKFPDPALSPTGLQTSLASQDIVMKRAARLIGRLKDGGTGELINAANAGLLAPNFRVTAVANPWIEGGFVVAAASVAGRPIQADGYFRVGPLLPGVDYDLRLAQTSWDPSFLQGGSQNYAPVTLGGLRLAEGESRDVGVVTLPQGRSITGVVRSTATGAALGNVKVTARPSFGEESGLLSQTYTNNAGAYTLWVSTEVSNQFDVTAAPRDGNKASDGLVYGQVIVRNLNLLSATTANFLLSPLSGGVTGQVVVADAASGGALSYPFGDRRGFPAAAVNLQPQGVVPTNPLGDIEAATDERGFFSIPGLSTGIYTLHATSLGYGVFNATAAVTASSFRLFVGSNTPSNDLPGNVITLQRGATVTGRIIKSDGSAPSASEVKGVAAANFSAGEFVIGSVEADATARTVSAYTISGFRAGVSYDLVLISGDEGENVSFPAEGDGVSFSVSEATATKTINLTFTPARMDCLGTARALDAARTQFAVQVDCLKPLRNETALDADLDSILRVSTFTANGQALTAPNGAGSFLAGSKELSSDRKRLTATYQKAAGEARFSVRVVAAASDVDPTTGQNFAIDKAFDFYTGLESHTDGRVTNINGGSLSLNPSAQDELLGLHERGRLDFQPGTFAEGSDSASESSVVANPTVTVNVTMTKTTDRQFAQTLAIKQLGYVPAGFSAADSGSAYPAEVWAAMSKYRATAATDTVGGANPLSSFYSIFLPLGVRHSLKKRADLTMSFSTLVSTSVDPNDINVWFYNSATGQYEQESQDRRLDLVNNTITVSVDHFSTFVVLDSTPVLTSAVSFAGTDIIAASFPNPADCIPHSGILRNSTFFAGGTIPTFTGQMIRASLPPDNAQKELTVNIYNLSGQKVRSLPQGPVSGGQTYYMPWNCSNDNGQTVSSGVYFGEVKWGNYRKFIKMAIIKGSGL